MRLGEIRCIALALILGAAMPTWAWAADVDPQEVTVMPKKAGQENTVSAVGFGQFEGPDAKVLVLTLKAPSGFKIEKSECVGQDEENPETIVWRADPPGSNETPADRHVWKAEVLPNFGVESKKSHAATFVGTLIPVAGEGGPSGPGPAPAGDKLEFEVRVADVDLDADSDNDNDAAHRPPSETVAEDDAEYPKSLEDDLIGLLIGRNDNNDVETDPDSPARDNRKYMKDHDKDKDILNLLLKINARKSGVIQMLYECIWVYDETDNEYTDDDFDRDVPKGDGFDKPLRIETAFQIVGEDVVQPDPGTVDSLHVRFHVAPPFVGKTPEDCIRYTVAAVDIDVDANNDGTIEPENNWNSGEDFYEAYPADKIPDVEGYREFKHGMLVPVNDDDDDSNDEPDNGWNGTDWTGNDALTIQGAADAAKMRPAILRCIGFSPTQLMTLSSMSPEVRLRKVSGEGAVRIFTKEADPANARLILTAINNDDKSSKAGDDDLWECIGEDDLELLVEGLASGEVVLAAEFCANGIVIHTDTVRLTIIQQSLTLYKRDGTTKVTKKIDPGAFVALNNDDDDADGGGTEMDKDDVNGVTGEDDLVKAEFTFATVFGTLQEGIVTIERANGKISLWKESTKGEGDAELTFTDNTRTYDLSDADERQAFADEIRNKICFVEGVEASAAIGDTGLTLKYASRADVFEIHDETKVTVVNCSLTLYKRDDTTAVGLDKERDPGAFVAYNNDDDDADGAGTQMDKDDANGVTGEDDLVKASFAFGSLFDGLEKGKVVIERKDGKLKLWKQKTKGADQEIAFTDDKIVYDLSNTEQRTAFGNLVKNKDLWVEGVTASTALGDTELTLKYEDGDSPSVAVCEDLTKITVMDCSLVLFKRDDATAVDLDKVRDPGAFVAYNNDDDDADGSGTQMDKDDTNGVTGEDDLVTASFVFGSLFDGLEKGKVVIERKDGKLKLWKQKTKGADQEVAFTDNKKVYDLSNSEQRTAFADELKNKSLWVEGVTASTALGDTELTLKYEDGDAPSVAVCEDTTKVTVVDCSLTLYKRDDTTAVGLDKERAPGAFVAYNNDDDDADGTADKEDANGVTGEDDLVKAKFTFGALFDGLEKGKVVIERKDGKLKLWKQKTKGTGQEVSFTDNKIVYDLSNTEQRTAFTNLVKNKDLWVEGVTASTAIRDTELTLKYEDGDSPSVAVCEDPTKITVVEAWLEVYPGDGAAALGLDKKADPGAYLWLNQDDDDADDTQDNSDGATANEDDLVKVKCKLGTLFTGLTKGKIVLERKNGKIKLWKSPTKGTDTELVFTANKIEYDLATPEGRTAMAADLVGKDVYVEGYDTSDALKDSELKLTYEDGDTTSTLVCVDFVTLTVFRLEVTQMSFNHNRSAHATDGVNIRKSYTASTEITAPEWQADGADAGTDPDKYDEVLYVAGSRVTINVSVSIAPAVTSAKVRAIASPAGLSLGNLGHAQDVDESWKTVTFTSGQASDVPFVPRNAASFAIRREEAQWQWVVNEVGGVGISPMRFTPAGQKKPIVIYTILGAPTAPWDASDTAGDDRTQPWENALKRACGSGWAGGAASPADAAGGIANGLNKSGRFKYDTAGGAPYYSSNSPGKVQLTKCIERLNGLAGNGELVNCMDCGSIVSTFANLMGADLWSSRMYPSGGGGFATNEYTAIGRADWTPPAWGWSFSYHEVGWTGTATAADRVYDACLEVDGDADPTGAGAHASKELPQDRVFDISPSTSATAASANPGNTGAGTMSAVATTDSATRTESWTVTYDGSHNRWDVVGSKSGAQGHATCGVAFTSTNGAVVFTVSWPAAVATTPAGSGVLNGATMSAPTINSHTAVNETWTVTYDATNSVWSVAGSVSGAKPNATPGVAYDNGIVGFTITHGAAPPDNGASISFDVQKCWTNGDEWTFDTTHTYDDYREKLAAPGTGGISACQVQAGTRQHRTPE